MRLLSPVRLLLLLLVSCSALVSVRAAQSSATAATGWPMYQGNAAHTGFIPESLGARPTFYLKWRRKLGQISLNPVTVADGKLFVSEVGRFNNPGLMTLDAASGNTLWETHYGNINSCNPPSYADGKVYIQTGNHSQDTYLRAYDAGTGAPVFTAPHSAQWESYFAPTIHEGTIYVNGGMYGGMYAFNALSGESLWFAALPQYDQWTPAVDDQYAYAYVGEYSPGLYVHDRRTGALAFQIPDPDFDWRGWSMGSAPVIGSAGTVLGAYNRRLVCFDLAERKVRWVFPVDYDIQPAVRDGVVYAIQSGSVAALKEGSGALLWSWTPPDGLLSGSILLTHEHLIAATEERIFALNLRSRKVDTSFPARGHLTFADGSLYVAQADGMLLAIGLGLPAFNAPSQVPFGKVKAGRSKQASLTVKNTGNVGLKVFGTSGLTLPFQYAEPALPLTIPPGASRSLTFTFAPGNKGSKSQKVAVETNDPQRPSVKIKLNGTGR